jgi:hypothetical protein
MNTIKCLSLLIASSLLSTAVLAQNAKPMPAEVAMENDLKPVVAKPIVNTVLPLDSKPTLAPQMSAVNALPLLGSDDRPIAIPSPLTKENAVATNVIALKPQVKVIDGKVDEGAALTAEQKSVMNGTFKKSPNAAQVSPGLTPVTIKAEPIIAQPVAIKPIEN